MGMHCADRIVDSACGVHLHIHIHCHFMHRGPVGVAEQRPEYPVRGLDICKGEAEVLAHDRGTGGRRFQYSTGSACDKGVEAGELECGERIDQVCHYLCHNMNSAVCFSVPDALILRL